MVSLRPSDLIHRSSVHAIIGPAPQRRLPAGPFWCPLRRMLRFRNSGLSLAVLAALPFFAGCTYVHFGRQPAIASEVLQKNTQLETEKAQLQKELDLSQQ